MLPKKWTFNEFGSVASFVGAILSAVAIVWTVRPDKIQKALQSKS